MPRGVGDLLAPYRAHPLVHAAALTFARALREHLAEALARGQLVTVARAAGTSQRRVGVDRAGSRAMESSTALTGSLGWACRYAATAARSCSSPCA
jgi:hypothetical protein